MQPNSSRVTELPASYVEKSWQKNGWLYDPVVKIFFLPFGGEGRFRRVLVNFAGVNEGERVLDACCGTGTLTQLIAKKAGKTGAVTGIDLSSELLKKAAKKAKNTAQVTFIQANCSDEPFPDCIFDKIFISFGFHEIAETERHNSLLELNRVLKPDGSLFVFEYHLPSVALAAVTVRAFHRLFEDEEAYRVLLNRALLPELERAGFKINRKRLIGAGMFQMLHAVKA